MRIALVVEGKTEVAFLPHLRRYLDPRLPGKMPKLDPMPYHGRIPTGTKLRRVVEHLLNNASRPADHVIALTDVYTGTQPPDFPTAADAKARLRESVGPEERFHPHVALHDFEAWLLPYWSVIQKLAGHNRVAPGSRPEAVNHECPPSYHVREIFRIGRCRDDYVKPRDAGRILREVDLSDAISQCPELKALVNTLLSVCGADAIL